MHFPVYVIIGPDGSIESQVDRTLEPYCEDRDVAPYKEYLDPSEINSMAVHLNLTPKDLHSLAPKMSAWRGRKGGVDSQGLFVWSTDNPSGRWDWFVIGGCWDGYIHGKKLHDDSESQAEENTVQVAYLLGLSDKKLRKRLPNAIVAMDAYWQECPTESCSEASNDAIEERWLAGVRAFLAEYPEHRVVCVDAHC